MDFVSKECCGYRIICFLKRSTVECVGWGSIERKTLFTLNNNLAERCGVYTL